MSGNVKIELLPIIVMDEKRNPIQFKESWLAETGLFVVKYNGKDVVLEREDFLFFGKRAGGRYFSTLTLEGTRVEYSMLTGAPTLKKFVEPLNVTVTKGEDLAVVATPFDVVDTDAEEGNSGDPQGEETQNVHQHLETTAEEQDGDVRVADTPNYREVPHAGEPSDSEAPRDEATQSVYQHLETTAEKQDGGIRVVDTPNSEEIPFPGELLDIAAPSDLEGLGKASLVFGPTERPLETDGDGVTSLIGQELYHLNEKGKLVYHHTIKELVWGKFHTLVNRRGLEDGFSLVNPLDGKPMGRIECKLKPVSYNLSHVPEAPR